MRMVYTGDLTKYDAVDSVLLFQGQKVEAPRLSFCIPAYRRTKTLQETVESIMNRHFDFSYEIIICDNSADLTENNSVLGVVRQFEGIPVSLYVNRENLGMTGNWNRLVQMARGRIIAFIHDDDLLGEHYDRLANDVMRKIQEGRLGRFGFLKVGFRGFQDGEELPTLPDRKPKLLRIRLRDSLVMGVGPTTTPTCGMMFSKEALLAINGFQESCYPCADQIAGFIIQEKGFAGYMTADLYAYYRWGANESLNINTQIQTYQRNTEIRGCFYSHSGLYTLYGKMFEKAHRYQNLTEIVGYCKKSKPDFLETDLEKEGIHPSGISIALLKLQKQMLVLSRQIRRKL